MREIKFRVWDKLSKRFTFPESGYQGHYIMTLNGRFMNLQNGSGGDEYIVQQFTGLKDIDQKDIYEGDIVEFDSTEYSTKPVKGYAEVIWYDNLLDVDAPQWALWFHNPEQGLHRSMNGKMKVIGDIFILDWVKKKKYE